MLLSPGPMIDLLHPVDHAHPLNRQLVSWFLTLPWPRWSGGATWRDMMMRHDGTLTNMTPGDDWEATWFREGGRGCLAFDGSNDYMNTGSFGIGTAHTIAWWMNYQDSGDGAVIGSDTSNKYIAYLNGSGASNSIFYNRGGNFVSVVHGGISSGDWHHWAVSRNGTSVSFYLDAAQIGSTQTLTGNNDMTLQYVGREAGGFYTQMQLDDLRVYNRALSGEQITQVYLESRAGYPNALNWLTASGLPVAYNQGVSLFPLVNAGLVNRGLVNAGLVG